MIIFPVKKKKSVCRNFNLVQVQNINNWERKWRYHYYFNAAILLFAFSKRCLNYFLSQSTVLNVSLSFRLSYLRDTWTYRHLLVVSTVSLSLSYVSLPSTACLAFHLDHSIVEFCVGGGISWYIYRSTSTSVSCVARKIFLAILFQTLFRRVVWYDHRSDL